MSIILTLRRLRPDCHSFEVGLGYRVSQAPECDSLFQNKSNKKKHHSSRSLAQQVPDQALEASILWCPGVTQSQKVSSHSHRLYWESGQGRFWEIKKSDLRRLCPSLHPVCGLGGRGHGQVRPEKVLGSPMTNTPTSLCKVRAPEAKLGFR